MFQVQRKPGRELTQAQRLAYHRQSAVARASRQGEHGMHLAKGKGRWGKSTADFRPRSKRTRPKSLNILNLKHPWNISTAAWRIPAAGSLPLKGDDNFLGKSLLKKLRKKVTKFIPAPLKKVISFVNPLKSPLSPLSYMAKAAKKVKVKATKKKAAAIYAAPYKAIEAARQVQLEQIKQAQAQGASDAAVIAAQHQADADAAAAVIAQQQVDQQAQDQAAALAQQQAQAQAAAMAPVSTPEMPYIPTAPTPTMLPPSTAYQYAPSPMAPAMQYGPQAQPPPMQQAYEQPPMAQEWDSGGGYAPPQQVSEEIDQQMPSELPGEYTEEGQFPTSDESEDIMQQTTDEEGYPTDEEELFGVAPGDFIPATRNLATPLLLVGAGVAAYYFLGKKRR